MVGDKVAGDAAAMIKRRTPNRIRALRMSAGLTLEQLAEAVDTTATQIHRLESGKAGLTLEWMSRLAIALRQPMAALLPPDGKEARIGELQGRVRLISSLIEAGEFQMAGTLARALADACNAADLDLSTQPDRLKP